MGRESLSANPGILTIYQYGHCRFSIPAASGGRAKAYGKCSALRRGWMRADGFSRNRSFSDNHSRLFLSAPTPEPTCVYPILRRLRPEVLRADGFSRNRFSGTGRCESYSGCLGTRRSEATPGGRLIIAPAIFALRWLRPENDFRVCSAEAVRLRKLPLSARNRNDF